eukprot:4333937-Prymnesium_polylepis.1
MGRMSESGVPSAPCWPWGKGERTRLRCESTFIHLGVCWCVPSSYIKVQAATRPRIPSRNQCRRRLGLAA